ncbi:MAG: hypothetical protein ACQKBT_01695 [Puniceicoccales bacterium]
MQAVARTDVDIANDRKSADWKVWIAAELKRHTSAPSTWIAHKLNMGSPQLVGVYAKRLEREIEQKPSPQYRDFISKYTE